MTIRAPMNLFVLIEAHMRSRTEIAQVSQTSEVVLPLASLLFRSILAVLLC